jgi:molybdate transport system substrate-binding protein
MMMKKSNSIWFVVAILMVFFSRSAAATDLYWYLAASMTKPGQEMVETFNRGNHPFTVILITGGSGQLLSKIKAAGKGDLYTPASTSYAAKAKDLGLLENHIPLIIQTPVFALSASGKEKIHSWSDLTKSGMRIGLGNPKTMALGRSYLQIQEKMGPELTTLFHRNKVVEAVNVSQIINYLKSDIIDTGITFDSTAKANKLSYIEIPAAYNQPEVAPLIRLKSEANGENSSLFIDFIMANLTIFERHGFRPMGKEGR